MPPADTTTRRPARSRGSASGRSSSSRASSAISAGSGSRPGPVSRPVSRPEAGSMTTDAAVAQQRHVVPRGRVLPHLGVHRGREQHRAAGREQRGGQQVVGAAVRGAGQQVRRRRGDDHEVRLLAQLDVRHRRDVGEHPGVHGLPGQRLERGGADELAAPTPWAARGPRARSRSAAGAARTPCRRRCRRPPRAGPGAASRHRVPGHRSDCSTGATRRPRCARAGRPGSPASRSTAASRAGPARRAGRRTRADPRRAASSSR